MRAWLNPDKMASIGLTTDDVVQALSQQNLQVAAGSIGQQPVPNGQQFQLIINTLGRLTDPSQFGDVIIKVGGTTPSPGKETNTTTASIIRLGDIARLELGAANLDRATRLNGAPAALIARTSSPKRAKSADRIDGAMRTGRVMPVI